MCRHKYFLLSTPISGVRKPGGRPGPVLEDGKGRKEKERKRENCMFVYLIWGISLCHIKPPSVPRVHARGKVSIPGEGQGLPRRACPPLYQTAPVMVEEAMKKSMTALPGGRVLQPNIIHVGKRTR